MQGKLSSSAGATYLDRQSRIKELRLAAGLAQERIPEIRRVILFGSLASGIATPRSDADLLITVESSPYARPGDRLPEMLRAFSPSSCPLDLFVLTCEEFDRYRAEGSPIVREALKHGMDLL